MSKAEEEEKYNLHDSTKLIGQLYPRLLAADGSVLDGKHRAVADPAWRTEILENIDSPEKKLVVRLVSNIVRRSVSKAEKTKWINGLADIYKEQGLKVNSLGSHKPNEIANRVAEVTGLHVQTIRRYLSKDFKNEIQGKGNLGKGFVSAEQAILSRIGTQQQDYGKRLIQRFKEEHKTELLKSPLFRAEVMNSLPKAGARKAFAMDTGSRSGLEQIAEKNLPEDVYRNDVGMLCRGVPETPNTKKTGCRGRPKGLPKGEGLPKKEKAPEILVDGYYETFTKECPGCICSQCPHAMECVERVLPDEVPMISRLNLNVGAQKPGSPLKVKV